MSKSIDEDFAEMGKKLAVYVDKGRLASAYELTAAPRLSVQNIRVQADVPGGGRRRY